MVKKSLLDKPYKKFRLQNEDILRNQNYPLEASVKISRNDSPVKKRVKRIRYYVDNKALRKVHFIKSFS